MKIIGLLSIFLFAGCRTEKYVIENQKFYDFQINVLVAHKISKESTYEIIHVQVFRTDLTGHYVDSAFGYFFFWNKVIREDHWSRQGKLESKTNIIYQTVNDNNYSLAFSHLDSLVFSKVRNISDSLKIDDFNFLSNARGFSLKKSRRKNAD